MVNGGTQEQGKSQIKYIYFYEITVSMLTEIWYKYSSFLRDIFVLFCGVVDPIKWKFAI